MSPTQGQRMVELGELGTVTYSPMGEASDEGVGQRVLLLTEDKRHGWDHGAEHGEKKKAQESSVSVCRGIHYPVLLIIGEIWG